MTATAPLVPPFTRESALAKVRRAEDAWNTRDPELVALAYTPDSRWRNRSQFVTGRAEIVAFLTGKWASELDYRLIKELWAHDGDRISVRFQYEYRDAAGAWFRAHGNEQWEFDASGLMRRREASINDVPIAEANRKFLWPELGSRPEDYPGLTELGALTPGSQGRNFTTKSTKHTKFMALIEHGSPARSAILRLRAFLGALGG